MCGIIGYIGSKHPKDILISGLRKLEYRGYDSSGIALKNGNEIQIIKSLGKIDNLVREIDKTNLIEANIGIAHTRWATHGIPSVNNAHPHRQGKITIVHNGIIENAKEIKKNILKDVHLKSETDTEILCALINKYYDGNMLDTLRDVQKIVKGSYALGIIAQDQDKLFAIKKNSPLIVGFNTNEYFIASDVSAIANYVDKYVILDEDEFVEMSKDKIIFYKNKNVIEKDALNVKYIESELSKNGYEHYMLKEIMEEPKVIKNTLAPFLNNLNLLPNLDQYEEIHIVACGSALYAGMVGKILLEEKANLKVVCEVASEYRYKKIIYNCKTLVILVSQSGETADTIAAMKKAEENNIPTLAIVNVKNSTIARESDMNIFIEAGNEIAVATTKAYLLQVLVLSLLAYKTAISRGLTKVNIKKELLNLPKKVEEVLEKREIYLNIARQIYKHNNVFFIGRKVDYAICLEGSLKLKEVSYIHSEAYQAGELKHGTISLIEKDTPVFAIITDEEIRDKTLSNIEEVKSRGANTIIISNSLLNGADFNIKVPKISEYLQPILIVPCLQLIAYETAKLRGCEIDQPKNLAKSVTVE